MDPIIVRPSSGSFKRDWPMGWGFLLAAWFLILCVIPDPRPLGAPEWAVSMMRDMFGISEPSARATATIALRTSGLALLGLLLALFFSTKPTRVAVPAVLFLAPLLTIACLWVNYGYYPVFFQLQIGVASALVGALAGLALRQSRIAKAAFIVFTGGLFLWGTSTGISDDLDASARMTGWYVLAKSDEIPKGDAGFEKIVEFAFRFAEDNSHGTDAVEPNKAAILALGVILGENRVAEVAGRHLDATRQKEMEAIRSRVTLRGRNDLSRHFWVSAALTVLSDDSRSITVGITKELMDTTPGGSGFSFVDLAADRAGTLFAKAATQSGQESARQMQWFIREGVSVADFCPTIDGLPEGISRDEFQSVYGGLGGKPTAAIVDVIEQRIAECRAVVPR